MAIAGIDWFAGPNGPDNQVGLEKSVSAKLCSLGTPMDKLDQMIFHACPGLVPDDYAL